MVKQTHTYSTSQRGMTLVDVVVGTAIMLMVFLGLFGAFKLSIELVFSTKAKTGAVFLVGEKLEHIRLLAYDSVGTVGGIPQGSIPQTEEVVLNGIPYTIRTLIQYVDDPADGLGEEDENGIVADYKRVKVEATWSIKESIRSTSVLSDIAPVGVESVSGGGTLKVNVFNAQASAVAQATVRIVNNTLNPIVDVSAQTNDSGSISFPGALEGSEYEITVSKAGYSTARTYATDAGNPNPSPGHVAVISGQTSAMSFGIDQLSSLLVSTFEPIRDNSFSDSFIDTSKIAESSNTTVSEGDLMLASDEDGFIPFGYAFSNSVEPEYLHAWDEVRFSTDAPEGTVASIHLYYWDGEAYSLVPDSDVSNNSTGLLKSPVDISFLSTETYSDLQLYAGLESADSLVTARVLDWEITYEEGPLPLADVAFDIHGEKIIGSDSEEAPIYKFDESFVTGSAGERNISDIEWDTYVIGLPPSSPYALVERCPNTLVVTPNSNSSISLTVDTKTTHSLRAVVAFAGDPVSGATVTLSGAGGGTQTTSTCGQVYFSGLTSGDRTITINKTGFEPYSENVTVSGESSVSAILIPVE
ncbi:hypothetical protein COU15_01870 [Candidatus Kaiserbacteria bacterium CG10_big_fil_rev_8_21_14_0_10_45_20]|uniref:PEGA domain-containing protein n=1 Tax=Candidatus Kaiserbacteria bacterium CG10_big_fil_rev_8_21_14_0_10_45_20 TaxID=1974607 RepID=A0A2H0UH54_9BACT|nr:MAG: hypothetical protein COU15_01870 [Candidatus Kaiserbacteria bacterium CG10_big_fil_rev_8_21_14_0_10_45_20]